VLQYQNGNAAMRPAIAETVDHIMKNLLSPSHYPKAFDRGAHFGLQGIFNPIESECNRLRKELFAAKEEKKNQKATLEKAKNDRLSLILNKEQKLLTSHFPSLKAFLEKLAEEI